MERVGDDGEDGEGVDEADHSQGVCVVHLQTNTITNEEIQIQKIQKSLNTITTTIKEFVLFTCTQM